MSTVQVSRHCKECGRKTLHAKHKLGTGMAVLLTLLTGGLFLLVWLPYCFFVLPLRPYRCQSCGTGRLR